MSSSPGAARRQSRFPLARRAAPAPGLRIALGRVRDRTSPGAGPGCLPPRLQGPGSFQAVRPSSPGSTGSCHNLAIDLMRKPGRRDAELAERTVIDEDTDFPLVARIDGADPLDVVRRREIAGRIQVALDALPPYHRGVILMREVEGMSYEEMAQAMGVSKGTIMSRLFHARRSAARPRRLLRGRGPLGRRSESATGRRRQARIRDRTETRPRTPEEACEDPRAPRHSGEAERPPATDARPRRRARRRPGRRASVSSSPSRRRAATCRHAAHRLLLPSAPGERAADSIADLVMAASTGRPARGDFEARRPVAELANCAPAARRAPRRPRPFQVS